MSLSSEEVESMSEEESSSDISEESSSEENSEDSEEASLSAESEKEEENDEICFICKYAVSGTYYICDNCPRSFHGDCRLRLGKYHGKKIETVKDKFFKCKDLGFPCDNSDRPRIVAESISQISYSKKCKRAWRLDKNAHKKKRRIRVWDYESVKVGETTYSVGDYAMFNSGTDSIAVIISIYQTDTQRRDKENFHGHLDVLWFYRLSEVPPRFARKRHKKEIFLQNPKELSEPENIEALDRKIVVYNKETFDDIISTMETNEGIYFCNRIWDSHRKRLTPVPDFETEIENYMKTKKILENKTKKKKGNGKKKRFDNVYQNASSRLQLSHIPKKLPCRDKEYKILKRFLRDAIIKEGHGSGYYISGMPGTGKTATVNWIIRELQELSEADEFPQFDYLEINAMRLQKPQEAYSKLYYELEHEHKNWSSALSGLERLFTTPSIRPVLVVVIDELDYFVTRKQKVLYNFFDWPSRKYTKMVVLGIANTMDLPERLQPRVQSRIGVNRLEFPPYNSKQIMTIINERLSSLDIFAKDAIKFCAMKASKTSGDIRRALQICRRAAEIREKKIRNNADEDKHVAVSDVNDAVNSLFSSSVEDTLIDLPVYTKLIMASCLLLLQKKTLDFENICYQSQQISRAKGISPVPGDNLIEEQINVLRNLRIISKEWDKNDPCNFFVRLSCEPSDVHFGLKEDRIFGSLVAELKF